MDDAVPAVSPFSAQGQIVSGNVESGAEIDEPLNRIWSVLNKVTDCLFIA
jgi:hypothetical protein